MCVAPAAESAAPAAIELRGVVKDFASGLRGKKVRALDHLDLRVNRGEVFGLLGPNGSGKSTAIKTILGLLKPGAGTCAIFGNSSTHPEARRLVGYLPEAPQFYAYLTGRELLRFYGRLCEMDRARLRSRVEHVLAQVGLTDAGDRRVGTYSKGMLQRIGLAQAMVHDPELLILDEPTAGLDPLGTAAIADLILHFKSAGKTVLITSHLLTQIEEVCDQIAILAHGRLVMEGKMPDVLGAADDGALAVDGLTQAQLVELHAWLAERGGQLRRVPSRGARLDRLFLERVARNGSR